MALTTDEKIAELKAELLEEIKRASLGLPNVDDPDTKWIVFYEPVVEPQEIRNPVTGEKETVPVATTKEHRVPIDVWAEYERAHGWA